MHWASFDPFWIDDVFWQDKMGMPVANRQFLKALFLYGNFESYCFLAPDTASADVWRKRLASFSSKSKQRIIILPRAVAPFHFRSRPPDVIHNGDFTFYMPYAIEWRNNAYPFLRFPITGITHSLDTVAIYMKCLTLLLSGPQPYDAVVCTSLSAMNVLKEAFGYIQEQLRKRVGKKVPSPPQLVHIPLGIFDDSERADDSDRTEARNALRIPEDAVVILTLARISLRNKMDLSPYLEGFQWLYRKIQKAGGPPLLLILSGGAKKEDMRLVSQLVDELGLKEAVRLEPNLPSFRKNLFYQAADIFCSLVDNFQETFGLSLIEAMIYGLPVIASDFDGYKELVLDGITGFLIETYGSCSFEPWNSMAGLMDPSVLRYYRAQKVSFNVPQMIGGMETLVRNKHLRMRMGENAKQRAKAFSWSRVIPMYVDLWEALGKEASRYHHQLEQAPLSPLLNPVTEKLFAHHPSYFLEEWHVVELSDYGVARRQEGFAPIRYMETDLFFSEECLETFLRILGSGSLSISDLLDQVQEIQKLPKDVMIFHLDWLLKHGYVVPQKSLKAKPSHADSKNESDEGLVAKNFPNP